MTDDWPSWARKAQTGWAGWQKGQGLAPDGAPGLKTLAKVLELTGPPDDAPTPGPVDFAPWMDAARAELGVKEIVGAEHSPRVLEYLASTSLGAWGRGRDETPWCSAFVNWCMDQSGFEGTNSASARSWLGWGLELDEPRPGCVVVLKRGEPPAGHVALFERLEGDTVQLLGGNQRNSVSVRPYPVARVIGYRWPAA